MSPPSSPIAIRRTAAPGAPVVSVVAPMMNEEENVRPLIEEIVAAMGDRTDYEIVFVDDGSRDGTLAALDAAKTAFAQLRVLVHGVNAGQSRALRTGVLAARGAVIVTLDGDGQNDPADIPALMAPLQAPDAPANLAMVSGRRLKRQDSFAKRAASRFANGMRKRVLRDRADDTGCGLKAFYRDAYLRLPYFDHMHRYLPALMRREGYETAFVDVRHRPRMHGRSKYTNFQRLAVALRDLLGVVWLNARARTPGDVREL